jgi:hypothetical protein
MRFFQNSDKRTLYDSEWFDLKALENVDLTADFQSSSSTEFKLFQKFSKSEVDEKLAEVGIYDKLFQRGYSNFKMELNYKGDLDNRIYIKDNLDRILVHIRLKLGDFRKGDDPIIYKLVYIDWLLTQNFRSPKKNKSPSLFLGQEYPGLGLMVEIKSFVKKIAKEIGAHGVFNVPEYFHDAVLFHKDFLFLKPEKESAFRLILSTFKKVSLRKLSEWVHSGQILDQDGKTYEWNYREMVSLLDPGIHKVFFPDSYFKKVKSLESSMKFTRKEIDV